MQTEQIHKMQNAIGKPHKTKKKPRKIENAKVLRDLRKYLDKNRHE